MLNACPKCRRSFPADEGNFCPVDASKLAPIDEVPVPPDPSDRALGTVVAEHYELRRVIADGGMGRVYEARDVGDQRRLAVKILHPEVAEDEVNIERFRREAETSHELDHAHIVEVFDFDMVPSIQGHTGAGWYLAMEYLDGEELRALLAREKTVKLPRVIRMVAQIALGLDPAHKRGLVHRDMKPDNVFLVRSQAGDRVKILDFGSVKFTKGQDKGNKLTVMGTTIGSPFYMSPEQAQGSPDLDQRADTWAVAVIIYEMVVGRVPFAAPNGPQILFKILGDEPMPPSLASDAAPPELDDFMHKALQKKPTLRFQSCGELADALGRAFGLAGNHADWATRSEADLADLLDAGLRTAASSKADASRNAPGNTSGNAPGYALGNALGNVTVNASGDAGGSTEAPFHSEPAPRIPGMPGGPSTFPRWAVAVAALGAISLFAALAVLLLRP